MVVVAAAVAPRPFAFFFFSLHHFSVIFTMSTLSKITLASTLVFATGSFIFINYSQIAERDSLREGPIKDAARMREKQARFQDNKKLMRNDLEHQEQLKLREQYEKMQPLTGEIIRGEE